jgi:hypothetical protein
MHRGPFGLLPLALVPFAFASVIDASLCEKGAMHSETALHFFGITPGLGA